MSIEEGKTAGVRTLENVTNAFQVLIDYDCKQDYKHNTFGS